MMKSNMTIRRLDVLRSALCHYENHYEGEEPPHGFATWDEFQKELDACHAWINQTQRKRLAKKIIKEG